MIAGFLRLLFNSIVIGLILIIGIAYYVGYTSGQENVESQAIANGFGRYVKTFKDTPDGGKEVEYTFFWTDKIPEGAITSKSKPSWTEGVGKKINKWCKDSGVTGTTLTQPVRNQIQSGKVDVARNQSLGF